MTRLIVVAVLCAAWFTAPPCEAQRRQRVRIRVVDIAGGQAYLSPGSERGLRVGTQVTFGRRHLRVVGLTSSYAVVALDDHPLRVGARGVARVSPQRTESGEHTPPPPLSAYRGIWPDAQPPAVGAEVEHVAIAGALGRTRQLMVGVSARGSAFIPLRGTSRGPIGRAALRVRVSAQPFADVPLRIDADAAVQLFVGDGYRGEAAASRPNLRVRQLQISYGQQQDFYAALGRLRYAAATLGQLDGLRVQTPRLGPLTVAAFGGFVPDPRTGEPAFDVGRFGLEVTLQDLESELRPVVSVVGHGSVYGGEIDERRVSASFHLYPGESHIGGHVEVSAFDADNPFGAEEVEVTAASLGTTLRFGVLRVGARGSMRQPARSKWLAALYPASFLCTPLPDPGGGGDLCDGLYDMRVSGTADVGVEVDDVAVTGGATVLQIGTQGDFEQYAGFAAFRWARILGYGHLDVSLMAASGAVLETLAARATLGIEIVPSVLDISLRYRPAVSRYTADIDPFAEHLFGGRLLVRPVPDLEFVLNADGLVGRQMDAFIIQLATSWHGAFL